MKKLLFCSMLLLTACVKNDGLPKEFVCYDDGKLVERHVGVESAVNYNSNSMWYIKYADSNEIVGYNQPAGETCQVEVVVE